jgi:hypothetical protein
VRLLVDALDLDADAARAFRETAQAPLPADLPAQASSFIGRAHAVTELSALVAQARLVTLTGAGGVGKTRLALVLSEHAGGARFRMLEPVREIARERLESSPVAEQAHDRHAEYFVSLAESVHGSLWGRRAAGGGIARLEADLDNCRAALHWSIAQRDTHRAGRLGAALARFWLFSGRVSEGRSWLDALLSLDEQVDAVRARLLVSAAAAATLEFDLLAARAFAERSLEVAGRAGDDFALGWALFLLGWGAQVAAEDPDLDRALAAHAEGSARARAAGDPVLELMHDLSMVGLQLRKGDLAGADVLARDGLRRARTVGAPREIARALMLWG